MDGRKLTHKIMLGDKIERPFGKTWKEALKRFGITALTLPLVALICVTLLFLAAAVGWLQRVAVEALR